MSLTMSALLESVANIKTLLIEGSFSLFSLVNCCHNCRAKLVSTVKKYVGRHHDLVDLYNMAASGLLSNFMPSVKAY